MLGINQLIRAVWVPKTIKRSSKGEINTKLPNVSAQFVPYANPKKGAARKKMTTRSTVTALRISIFPIFILAI